MGGGGIVEEMTSAAEEESWVTFKFDFDKGVLINESTETAGMPAAAQLALRPSDDAFYFLEGKFPSNPQSVFSGGNFIFLNPTVLNKFGDQLVGGNTNHLYFDLPNCTSLAKGLPWCRPAEWTARKRKKMPSNINADRPYVLTLQSEECGDGAKRERYMFADDIDLAKQVGLLLEYDSGAD